ncbi:MAG: hypothetical protein GY694_18330 [Gammaproteobacteria bacterium]|nr:hypothetical protein [Gammaproteobacteria bacterium]
MKWLFILVALLNITYAAYNFLLEDASIPVTKTHSSSSKGQIVQLNEIDSSSLHTLQQKTPPQTEVVETIEQSAPEEISMIDMPAPTPTPKMGSIIEETQTESCYKLGPFTKDVMIQVRVLLETEYQNKLSFGIETTSAITYYRIYIPPLKDKEKIKKALSILDKNNMKDHYVMSIDGRKNAIALGVFKQRSAAEKVAEKATKIGFSTTIEAISDDKNSLYQLMVIFQKNQDTKRYQEIILEKELISVQCENKG